MILLLRFQKGKKLHLCKYLLKYSSVPNRRIGPNKRAGGKILKKNIKRADPNKAVQGGFFSQN